MTVENVEMWLSERAPDIRILRSSMGTATVADAAHALGVEPARIAKSIAVRAGGAAHVLVLCGDRRLDNVKLRAVLGGRCHMLEPAETSRMTGHPVGGVTPVALASPLQVWMDLSLRQFSTVFPAAGSPNSAFEIEPQRLAELTSGAWADFSKDS